MLGRRLWIMLHTYLNPLGVNLGVMVVQLQRHVMKYFVTRIEVFVPTMTVQTKPFNTMNALGELEERGIAWQQSSLRCLVGLEASG